MATTSAPQAPQAGPTMGFWLGSALIAAKVLVPLLGGKGLIKHAAPIAAGAAVYYWLFQSKTLAPPAGIEVEVPPELTGK